jgi:anti-sigma factor RsiW
MNDPTLIGPCAEYEYDLVELQDGALAPERTQAVRRHLDACPRCRAWARAFATLDARLAAELPQLALPADFEPRLQARLTELTRRASTDEQRAAADGEYERMVEWIRRGTRRHVLLDTVVWVAATVCALVAAHELAGIAGQLLPAPQDGPARWIALGGLGATVAIAALAWAARRSGHTLRVQP